MSRASINSLIVTNAANTIQGRIKFEGEKMSSNMVFYSKAIHYITEPLDHF